MKIGDVPCNGCTLCCIGDAVRLLPKDDATQYQTEPHPWYKGELMLAHKGNGECIYLGEGGCTIHGRRPQMCREFDCRLIAQNLTYTQARKMEQGGQIQPGVWRRGKDLLKAGSAH